jgi:hypothetical protein
MDKALNGSASAATSLFETEIARLMADFNTPCLEPRGKEMGAGAGQLS